MIYDCMEVKLIVLNVINLSIWCGSNAVFSRIAMAGELKNLQNNKTKQKEIIFVVSIFELAWVQKV